MSNSMMLRLKIVLVGLVFLGIACVAVAEGKNYSPDVDRSYPENVYWGDTHVHTSRSPDAYTMMNRLDPEVAYRFAKGETVTSSLGLQLRIGKPLDFLVVSDHATFTGVFPGLDASDPLLLKSELGKRWHALYQQDKRTQVFWEFAEVLWGSREADIDEEFRRSVWRDVIDLAEKHNVSGQFSAFVGYEWTSTTNGNNLHRNLVFRDGPEKTAQILPFAAIDSDDPEDLWDWMASYEETTGGKVLAIPHNGNLSNGEMFASRTLSGEALTKRYAETRSRWEPIYEVTQVKGDGEAHPDLSPDDGFADFGTWDQGNMTNTPKEPAMLKHEYARSAFKLGLQFDEALGANPFKFGLIGSTDSHTSFANANEDNFFGKMSEEEPNEPGRQYRIGSVVKGMPYRYIASGYAAVWAKENTREALFDAMQRKETYATTGPRIVLRFFAGWDFESGSELRPDYVDLGYRKGVPMGADLIDAPEGQSPDFIVAASKDPDGANLDRIQIVKGWLDSDGQTHEKVYNVAVSDDRRIRRNGSVRPLQHTVDLDTATYFNSIGETTLATTWTDPDFDPDQRAFYYVRVLEIPTPRWTTYDSAFFNEPRPEEVPAVIQERAYSSPIWYTP